MLLTQTFESAVRELMFLASGEGGKPFSHKYIAAQLGESPTYMAKVTSLLVKASILRAHRGAMGGVTLNAPPAAITLLSVLEACQGTLVGDYCSEISDKSGVCAYHLVGVELQEAVSQILSRWTLARLMERAGPAPHLRGKVSCRLQGRFTGLLTPLVSIQPVEGREGSDAENVTDNLTPTEG